MPDAPPAPASKHHAIFRVIRPNGAVILLGILCALAVIEIMAAALEYRERVVPEDWGAVTQILEGHEGEPVIVASEWLGPSARMNLAAARTWDSIAYPDLRSFERFWLLTHARERPWRGPLRAELEGLPRPELVAVHPAGDLRLHEYRQAVGPERLDLLDSIASVSTPRGRCTAGEGRWTCKDGSLSVRVLEIDYRPRRCLAVELDDGGEASVSLGRVELGDRLRGHVGFGDFNARLRSDPSARVEVWLDGALAARWLFSDDQGWAAFALATPPGSHEVELRVAQTVSGTWQRDGYQGAPKDVLCVELRSFLEGGDGS